MKALGTLIAVLLAVGAAGEPVSKPIEEVLREPLPSEALSSRATDGEVHVAGPTFRYRFDRNTGSVLSLEAVREGRLVVEVKEPAALWLDEASLAKATGGVTKVVSEGPAQVVLVTECAWAPGVLCTVRNTVYNDGVLVSEVTLVPESDLEMRQGIRYDVNAAGRFTHYLHKRRDTEGMDCFKGALPKAGETVRMDTPTSCLQVFSDEAALAMFTDRGDLYRSPASLDSAAVRNDTAEGGDCAVALHQHIIHVGEGGAPYTLRAGEPFTFRVGLAVAPNRHPHPRWRDLRMFIWVGDEKHPYPTDDEIAAAARLGFTLFQMHRLGPPGEPRPPAEELDRVIRSVHDAGMLFLWTANNDLQYAHAPRVVELVNEGNWVRWQGFNYGGKYTASMDGFCNTLATCLASPNGLADYRIACKERMLERYAVDGMYIDDNLPYANCPLWKEHGHPQEVYDCLIELHEMNWRRRQALHAKCPHAVLIDHCSQGFVLPAIASFDGHLFGEGYSFPSVEAFRETFGTFRNMYASGSLFAGDSETTRCGAEVAYAFDLLTGGGQYCYLDWRLWPEKFPYASGVNAYEPLFIRTFNLAQYYFGLYESEFNDQLETTAQGAYGAVYHNQVWNENLVVLANMTQAAGTCSLASPDALMDALGARDRVVVYDVHARRAEVMGGEGAAVPFTEVPLKPFQVRLLHMRQAPEAGLYHQWGGKRISEHWDPAARTLSLRVLGPAGLEDWVVLGTGGNGVARVTVDGKPAEFYADPERGFVYGKVTFQRDPVAVEVTAGDEPGALPQQSIPPDDLTTEYLSK